MKSAVSEKLIRQLSVIEGQIRGLKKMVEEDTYCIDVITQLSAVRNSLSSVEEKILENHLNTCAITQIKGKGQEQAVSEILKVYKLAKRK